MKKQKVNTVVLFVSFLISLGACSAPTISSKEPLGTAKKPTADEAQAFCKRHAAKNESVEQCIHRILRL